MVKIRRCWIGVNVKIWIKRKKGEGDMELFDDLRGGRRRRKGAREREKTEEEAGVWVTLLLETRPIK